MDAWQTMAFKKEIRFRRKVTIDCGSNRLLDFKVYELTGDGVIPTVYRIDPMNRTVFVVSEMEASVLEA